MCIIELGKRLFQTKYVVNGIVYLAGLYASSLDEARHTAFMRGIEETVLGEIQDDLDDVRRLAEQLVPDLELLYMARRLDECIRGVLLYASISCDESALHPGGLVWQLSSESNTHQAKQALVVKLIELERSVPGTAHHLKTFGLQSGNSVMFATSGSLLLN